MITSKIKFTVKASVEVVWAYLGDVRNYARSIPGCVSCKPTGCDTHHWLFDFRVGPFVKRMEIRGKTIELDPPHYGKWIGHSDDAIVGGATTIKALENGNTGVMYTMEIEPKNIILRCLTPLIKEKMVKDLKQYARNVKNHLE